MVVEEGTGDKGFILVMVGPNGNSMIGQLSHALDAEVITSCGCHEWYVL
jgi:hypothetical protein